MGDPRKGHRRRMAIAKLRDTEPWVCWLCGLPIPRDVDPQTHPLRWTCDEVVPVSLGGSALDPANLRPAMAICNSARGNRPVTPQVRARCRQLASRHLGIEHEAAGAPSRNW